MYPYSVIRVEFVCIFIDVGAVCYVYRCWRKVFEEKLFWVKRGVVCYVAKCKGVLLV